MCTSISFQTKDHYFGRTLDLHCSYGEQVVVTPRNFPLSFRHQKTLERHFAMIGMAMVAENYPLYYEATNEKGLSVAGLNFPGTAVYHPFQEGKDNITPFEFIPWLLAQCETVADCEALLDKMNVLDEAFAPNLPLSPLHWMISDKERSITVESMADGLRVYDNPVGAMTNNPCFDRQLASLDGYLNLTSEIPQNRFSDKVRLSPCSHGYGAIGLPGDWSSTSRFVRICFAKLNAVCGDSEGESVSQFFHLLDVVSHPRGVVVTEQGLDITVYTSCCNTDKGIYYYKTYENPNLSAVELHAENLEAEELAVYSLHENFTVYSQN